jgi:hypothetical protein
MRQWAAYFVQFPVSIYAKNTLAFLAHISVQEPWVDGMLLLVDRRAAWRERQLLIILWTVTHSAEFCHFTYYYQSQAEEQSSKASHASFDVS